MTFPKIALIGRPNVGKSALFNRLLKKRIAIVDEMEGVTRDRLYASSEFEGYPFILIDTAGMQLHDEDPLNLEILEQSKLAIEEASFCFFVVDGRVGLTDLDLEISRLLHKSQKPVCVAVNKMDDEHFDPLIAEFCSLGFKDVVGVSASHGRHLYELLEMAFKQPILKEPIEYSLSKQPTLSIVGRTNVGKSTLINALTEMKRCVVSPEQATTRDAIEIELKHGEKTYTLIDTAGIRRKQKEKQVVEKFASIRTFEAIEKSDICLFMIDAQSGMTAQEKKLLSEIYERGKSLILLVNKWDLAKGFRMEHAKKALVEESPFLSIYPILFISALTKRNIQSLFPLVDQVYHNRIQRIETSALNRFFEKALHQNPPPLIKGKRLRIYYSTQIKEAPPSFLLFVNKDSLLTPTYKRYLINQMRKTFNCFGSPLQFFLKSKTLKTLQNREESHSKIGS